MAVNNETGVVQPVAEATAIARRHGALLHCDAVQAAGRIPIDRGMLGWDVLALSAHKLGGPTGSGALIADPALGIAPHLRGGGQERGRRAGTENVAGIAGFGAAAEAALAAMAEEERRLAGLRDHLEARLLAACPRAVVFGRTSPRVAGTLLISMPGVPAETQVMALDLDGVAVSAGAACSSGKVRRSHVLEAMGAGEAAGEAVRFSLGWASRPADIDAAAAAWTRLAGRLARDPDDRLAQARRFG
jgi:cysteine desulfurase